MGKFISAKWVLVAILGTGGVVAAVPAVSAQDANVVTKRKVKTKVMPEYPEIARQLHLEGKVKVQVTISPDGRVTDTKVIGGHPVLAQAAVEALKKWRFEPAPKETTEIIESNFDSQN
ncbi:MAG TPA: energy transducer TonB [Candidatus Acidoferrum sp.]|nr:energy transducer TonB [Candidatus Acidoferrum sp.]